MHPSFFDRFQAFGRGLRHPHHGHHGHCDPGAHHHAGRHHHRGFQGFGGHPDFPGDVSRGAGGLGPGRKLGSADLQLLILALLAEKPRHGYEIIKALDERSNGYYSPSPGMVYPALTYLEEIGHATVQADGAKKLYSVTVAGLSHLDENREAADTLLRQLEWIGQRMEHLRSAMAEDPQGRSGRGGRGRGHERGSMPEFAAEVREAQHALRHALIDKAGASLDEQRRIADILARAAAEIKK